MLSLIQFQPEILNFVVNQLNLPLNVLCKYTVSISFCDGTPCGVYFWFGGDSLAGFRKFYIYTDAFAQFEFQQNLFGIIRSEWRIRTAFFKFQ